MANELRKANKAIETSLTISNRSKEIVKAVQEVNLCIPFRMDGPELLHWALEIERIAPHVTPDMLVFLMDAFKKEELIWDRNKGIQNIFSGLKRVKRDPEGKLYIPETHY